MKIAVTGSTGLVGSRIIELLSQTISFIPLLQSQINITDKLSVADFIRKNTFDIFLHLAAYTNVDGAEKEKEKTHMINVKGTQYLFEAVKKKGKKFIYISTGFVFDGKTPPFHGESKPHPLGYYARSKYEGEKLLKDNALIVRISYPYRQKFDQKKDFVRGIIDALSQNKTLFMVTDSLITPTYIDDIAYGLKHLFYNFAHDIIHLVGPSSLSPYEAGLQIAKHGKFPLSLIQPISYNSYFKDKAPRPQFSQIISRKNDFLKMKSFDEGLTEVLKK